jgi:hypothetical protein
MPIHWKDVKATLKPERFECNNGCTMIRCRVSGPLIAARCAFFTCHIYNHHDRTVGKGRSNMKHIRTTAVIAALGISQAAHAAGNTPINTPDRAARSALYLLEVPNTLTQQINDFDYQARVIIEHGFDQLDAATSVQALLAAPHGIVVTCPLGGTLTARMSPTVPRTVRFEWADCQQTDLVGTYTQNGPAEATLIEASFSPKNLYGLRLGDANHDHIETRPSPNGSPNGAQVTRRNQRFVGLIPQRMFDYENIPGRFTYELTGFAELTQMRPDRVGGVPSVELYPFVTTNYVDHALISRERLSGYDANQAFYFHEDIEFAWGSLGSRIDVPQRPNKPAMSFTDEFGGLGLRIQNALEASGNSLAFDGKLQVARFESRGLGCAMPDVLTYRTRVRPTLAPDVGIGTAYAKGEVDVNGSTKITFTALPPSNPDDFTDARARLDITSPGLPAASFEVTTFDDSAVANAARCTP